MEEEPDDAEEEEDDDDDWEEEHQPAAAAQKVKRSAPAASLPGTAGRATGGPVSQPTKHSRYIGVSLSYGASKVGAWVASIHYKGSQQHLGRHASEKAAAQAFDTAARRYRGVAAHGGCSVSGFGQVQRVNFPTAAEETAFAQQLASKTAARSQNRSDFGRFISRFRSLCLTFSCRVPFLSG